MKITIDTKNKEITLCDDVNLDDFFKKIKIMLPEWKEYRVKSVSHYYNWGNPIVVPYVSTPYPWSNPKYISCGTTNSDNISVPSVFNVEC